MTDDRLNSLFLRFAERGDVAALAELFDALSPELLRVARHVAFDAAEAEDLVQAAFLTAMEHPSRFDATRSVSAWLVGVVSKEALAWRRSAARRPDPERLTEGPAAREVIERPEAKAADAETWRLLDAALARLPERYRDVLERHLRRGQSPSQIASEKNASPATVRVQLHRGMAQLRQWIPAGAAGAFALTLSERGLAAVRADLVAHAKTLPLGTAAAAAGGSAVSVGTISSLVMMQRLLLGAILFIVLILVGRQVLVSDRLETPPAIVVSPTISGPVFEESEVTEAGDEERLAVESTEGAAEESEVRAFVQQLVVETRWHDGTVAPKVGFDYVVWTDGEDFHGSARTDDQGRVHLSGLPAGHVSLYGDFGGTASVQLTEISTTPEAWEALGREVNSFTVRTLQWALPQGLDVTGRVVDTSGRGVGGAALWVTTGLHRERRRTVATSNADGSFLLPQLQSGCFFGASSADYAPSKPEHVQYWSERTDAGEAIELTLTLGEDAVRVTGTVLDSAGQPAVGARVRLGPQSQFDTFGPRGAEGPPPPLEVLTDDEGRFAASGLAPGKVEWACQFDEHATQAGVIQVATGSSADLQIRLDAGGYVRGRITDAEGRGLGSLTVASYQRAFSYPHPESSFDDPRTRTSSDGTFVLGPLASGEVRLSASTPDRKGSCEATLEVVAGASYTWNDTIRGLPVLTGRAVDRSGAGLEGWTVVSEAMNRPGPSPRAVFTNADGAFEMALSGQGSVRLKLFPPDHPDQQGRMWGERRAPEAWVDDVALDAQDVLIALNAEQEPRATLRARLVPPLGESMPKALIKVYHERWHEIVELELPAESTELVLPKLPAGSVTLLVEPVGFGKLRRDGIVLEQDGDLDLGDLLLQRAGRASVTIERKDGEPVERLDVRLRNAEGRAVYAPRSKARFELNGLVPGTYTLEVIAEDCGPARRQFEVVAEEEAGVQVALASGGSIGLAFAGETDEPLGVAVALRVRDADGVLFFDETLEPEENGYVSRWIFAPHGELQIEASLADGRTLDVQLPFPSGSSSSGPNILRFD